MKTNQLYYLTFLLLLYNTGLMSQNYHWDWAKSGGGTQPINNQSGSYFHYERVVDITVDSNNNYYYLMTYGEGNPNFDNHPLLVNEIRDVYLVSTDCQGNFRWDKEFGGEDIDFGYNVHTDTANNVYVSGETWGRFTSTGRATYWDTDLVLNGTIAPSVAGPHNRCAYIIKYNDQGVFQWIKFPDNGMLTANEVIFGFQGREMVVEPDGTIHWLVSIGAGTHVEGNITVPTIQDRQWMALRYDSAGNYLGHTNIDFEGNFTSESFSFNYDPVLGIYYFAAYRINGTPNFTYRGNVVGGNTFIAAIDEATGNDLWYKDGSNNNGTLIYDLAVDDSSNVYITGTSSSSSTGASFAGHVFDQVSASGSIGANAAFVIALDSSGNLIWGNNSDTFTRTGLTLTINNNEIALGYGLEVTDTWDGVTAPYGVSQGEDPAVIRLNKTTGVAISVEQIKGTAGQWDEVTALAVDNYGNYVVGGYMKSQLFLNDPNVPTISTNGGPADFFIARLAKTDCNGVLSTPSVDKINTSIYPNPVINWVEVRSEIEFEEYVIHNISGQQVLSGKFKNEQQLDISSLSSGMYFLRLKSQQNDQVLKLIKE